MHLLTARLPVFWKQREMRLYPVRILEALSWLAAKLASFTSRCGFSQTVYLWYIDHHSALDDVSHPILQGWCFALPTFLFRVPYALLDSTLW